jgi:hypothetical protein
MTPAKLRLARAAMADQKAKAADLCRELGVTRSPRAKEPRRRL